MVTQWCPMFLNVFLVISNNVRDELTLASNSQWPLCWAQTP